MEKIVITIILIICYTILFASNPGILNVSFDIDDTELYSKDIFSSIIVLIFFKINYHNNLQNKRRINF